MKELSGTVLYPTASASTVDYSVEVVPVEQERQVENLVDELFVHGNDSDSDSDSDSELDEDEEEEWAYELIGGR
jgi:hypothetical protein